MVVYCIPPIGIVYLLLMHTVTFFLSRAVVTCGKSVVGRTGPEKLISMSYTRILSPLTPTSHFSLDYYEIDESYPKSPIKLNGFAHLYLLAFAQYPDAPLA